MKKRKIQATGILNINSTNTNDSMVEWLDAKKTSPCQTSKTIGIDRDRKAKAIITIEIVEQPCEVRGKPT